ncbi:MAG TPA: LysR family transcriptional regulator [Bacteriovoracaceae bacterium]|nr:LysR family transcriptional regulator [Bacteriovoracaceae bacterium]
MITFKDLENFVMVAKSRTLSEASEKLEMAQPSLSLGIKKFETEMQTVLFIRSRDGIKLTPEGKALLPQAEESLRLLEQMRGATAKLRFKIGCHASVGIYTLGHFLKQLHAKNPNIEIEIVSDSSHAINKKVSQGEVDFGVVMNPLSIQGLVTKFIGEDDVNVWESKHRYQEKLLYIPGMLQAHSIMGRWKQLPRDKIEVQNLELLTTLVDSGAGYGIIPGQVVKAMRYQLKKVAGAPSFKDKLAVVCYPELLKSSQGRLIFECLKGSFNP